MPERQEPVIAGVDGSERSADALALAVARESGELDVLVLGSRGYGPLRAELKAEANRDGLV